MRQVTPENLMFYVGAFDRCSPARDGWDCHVHFGEQVLTLSRRVEAAHGLNFVVRGTQRAAAALSVEQEQEKTSHLQTPETTQSCSVTFTSPQG